MSSQDKKKTEVIINHRFCKLCGICVVFCPVKNLSIINQKLVEDGRCTGCHMCEKRCPDFAIIIKLTHEQEAITR
ncbi:MAG: 4Fe-4S binding protein [Candidatus Anammoxibacter sp.]